MDTAAGEKKMKKETSTASSGQAGYDHLLKLLMIGDTWAGKSTLVVRYMSNTFQNLFATIGVLSISLIFPLFQCIFVLFVRLLLIISHYYDCITLMLILHFFL